MLLLQILATLLTILQHHKSWTYAAPTPSPMLAPSLRPSINTRNPLETVTIVDCNMTFLPAGEDGPRQLALMPASSSISDWEMITSQHISDYLGSIQKQLSDVTVIATFIDQDYVQFTNAEDGGDDENLNIQFYVRVTFRDLTDDGNYDVYEGVGDAFITWNSGQNYIKKLNEVNPDVFPKPQNINVHIPSRPDNTPTSAPVVSGSEGITTQLLIVIIACAGGGSLILLIVYFYIRNQKKNQDMGVVKSSHHPPQRQSSQTGKAGTGQQVQVSTYIVTKPIGDEDISTLGYPTVTKPPGLAGSQVYGATKDEDISTLGEPTIFGGKSTSNNKAYKLTKQSSNSSDNFSSASDSILQGGGLNVNAQIYGSSETIATNPTLATNAVKKFTGGTNTARNFFEFSAPAGSVSTLYLDRFYDSCFPHFHTISYR